MRQGILAGRYPAVAAMVIFALVPFLGLSAALQPLSPIIGEQLHMSRQALSLTTGMANAGYAIGTILAVQFALHLPQRRMLLLYGVLLLIGSILAAAATAPATFIVGHVLQGLCTSLLLIAAVPPLVIGYPAAKARWTAMILNVCVFGAVALGPFVGGLQAHAHAWRPLFWIVAGIAAAALVLSVLTFQDAPPADREGPWDITAVTLAAGGCAAAFFGSSQLLTHQFLDPVAILPLAGGLLAIVVLLIVEYRGRRPLLNLRPLTSTFPVTGILVAISAAAASVSAIVLANEMLAQRYPPLHAGLLFLPEFGGAALSAVVFGAVFRTRGLHYFVLSGMVFLAAGILVVGIDPLTDVPALVGSALLGLGVGCSVAPALFIAGFSVQAVNMQRVFSIIELLRAVAAFMVAPVLVHVALTVSGGTQTALWICFAIAVAGTLTGVALYALARVRPPAPDFDYWLAGHGPGWYSPPLLAGARRTRIEGEPAWQEQ
jgi:MFS family permease